MAKRVPLPPTPLPQLCYLAFLRRRAFPFGEERRPSCLPWAKRNLGLLQSHQLNPQETLQREPRRGWCRSRGSSSSSGQLGACWISRIHGAPLAIGAARR